MMFDRKPARGIPWLFAAFLVSPAVLRAAHTKTGLLRSGDSEKLVIVVKENQPLVFFPDRLPVEIEIYADADDHRPMDIDGTFRPPGPMVLPDRVQTTRFIIDQG